MPRSVSFYIHLFIGTSLIYGISSLYSNSTGFREKLLDYIHTREIEETVSLYQLRGNYSGTYSLQTSALGGTAYSQGDWKRYVVDPKYWYLNEKSPDMMMDSDDVQLISYGSMKLNMNYGKSRFTSDKYRQSDEDVPVSRVVQSGFLPEQELLVHMEGRVGRRMSLYVDHDSRRQENTYRMQYRAVEEDEVIREINAGEIDIDFNHSKYAVYDNSSAKGLGVDLTLRQDRLTVKAFGSISRGIAEVERFRGNSSAENSRISEYQYIQKRYYQIEPFIRYDNMSSPPDAAGVASSNTWNSNGSTTLYSVNLNPSGFELYMDDQISTNNYNAIVLSLDGGYYTKLVAGSDYSINYSTGLITFLRDVPSNSRIFAVYNLQSGSTADPCSLDPGPGSFSDRIFVFLKYGYSINEDTDPTDGTLSGPDKNNDGKVNLDIYEVRSSYFIGDRNVLSEDFSVAFFRESNRLDSSEAASLGPYSIDYTKGIISFAYREPFKTLNPEVYLENQPSSVYLSSRYRIGFDYYRDARSFQLKHFNIIPNSVRVKLNGRVVSQSLYTVDYTSGYLIFTDPNNPVIGSDTDIEIRYEYLPGEGQTKCFIGGLRADYMLNRSVNLGGSLMYKADGSSEIIPSLADAPEQTVLYEADTSIRLSGRRMARAINRIAGTSYKTVPVEVKAYGEYARSYRKVNTFGKGLVDNMESTEEIHHISLSDKDWILSSPPSGSVQADRGQLYFYYYRNPGDPGELKTESYNASRLDYSKKPGPYNVAAGHLEESIESQSDQLSLVYDFEFSLSEDIVSVVTRNLSDSAVDFSGLQYIEVSFRFEGNTGDQVSLQFDMGSVNEDSDSDGILDTEDANGNGVLDSDVDAGVYEDRGYSFNGNRSTVVGSGPQLSQYTMGDGRLTSEDLNRNGTLDSLESVYSLGQVVNADSSSWQTLRIYVDRDALQYSDLQILRQVEALRFTIRKITGAATGRVFVDRLRFVSSCWTDAVLDFNSLQTASSSDLKVTLVNSLNDPDYRSHAFLFEKKDVYESLYGSRDIDELESESESALQLDYNVPGASSSVSVTRNFTSPLDLRHYRTMVLWSNYRSVNSGDQLCVRLASSVDDYVEYIIPMEGGAVWHELKLKLSDGSGGLYSPSSNAGTVDMKRIKYITVGIIAPGNSGKIWINDIYVTEPLTLASSAHWYETELLCKRPLYKTETGVPVLSDMRVKYVQHGHGAQFSTIGREPNDMSEETRELFASTEILPHWKARADFTREDSSTDSLNEVVQENQRGKTKRNSIYLLSDYKAVEDGVPSLTVAYTYTSYDNVLDEDIENYSTDVRRDTEKWSHAPVITLQYDLKDFLGGSLSSRVNMDMKFKGEDIHRSSGGADLSSYTSVDESEKRQRASTGIDFDYTHSWFYLKPRLYFGSEEVVEYTGKQESGDLAIDSDLRGTFHFPYAYSEDMRFVERNKKFQCTLGIKVLEFMIPEYNIEVSYLENSFEDYEGTDFIGTPFSRSRDARSCISSGLRFPVRLKDVKFLRNLSLTFNRSVYFTEETVPYEGESHSFTEEEYGISRPLGELSPAAMNLISYYPGYFFAGRDNFARGRDYVHASMNEGISLENGETVDDYNNVLRLMNNLSLDSTLGFNTFTVNTGAGIQQSAERQNIYGIPQELVAFNFNIDFNFDLMRLWSFGFFRPNKSGRPHHSANFDLSYTFQRSMFITSNMEEDTHTPGVGLGFKWDRTSITFKGGIDFRWKHDKEYIPVDYDRRNRSDDIYIENMALQEPFSERDYGYTFSAIYETDLEFLFNFFSEFYHLAAFPILTLEYDMEINRYDYSETLSPEPYDRYQLNGSLTMDLHKNVQGGISGKLVLEQYRNPDTNGISKEVFSYEISGNFSLLF